MTMSSLHLGAHAWRTLQWVVFAQILSLSPKAAPPSLMYELPKPMAFEQEGDQKPIDAQSELYVLQHDPPSITILDSEHWTEKATVPLRAIPRGEFGFSGACCPYRAHLDRNRGVVYLLSPWKLEILNVNSTELIHSIPLGGAYPEGPNRTCRFADDGIHLVCPSSKEGVIVIDTSKNFESTTVISVSDGKDVYDEFFVFNHNASRFFALKNDELHIFQHNEDSTGESSVQQPTRIKLLARGDNVTDVLLSTDEKSVYILSQGRYSEKKKEYIEDAWVYVVDAVSAEIVGRYPIGWVPYFSPIYVNRATGDVFVIAETVGKGHHGRLYLFRGPAQPTVIEIGSEPRFIRRIGDESGVWIFSHEDMRFLPDGASQTTARIPLNKKSAEGNRIGGYPGDALYLPHLHKLVMLIADDGGWAKGKVALLDLENKRVDQVISTGRGGMKVANVLGMVGTNIVLGAMAAPLGASPDFMSLPESHSQVVVKADGSEVYALNAATSDLTLIRTVDGAVLKKIGICDSCSLLSSVVWSPFIVAHTTAFEDEDQLTWLDTRTDKVVSSLKFRNDRIVGSWVMPKKKLFAILTSRSLVLWNMETGELLRRLDDLHNAVALAGDDVIQIIGFQSHYFAGRKPI